VSGGSFVKRPRLCGRRAGFDRQLFGLFRSGSRKGTQSVLDRRTTGLPGFVIGARTIRDWTRSFAPCLRV